MNYITNSEFLNYYDTRRVLELVSDTGVSAATTDLPTSTVLTTAIRNASSRLDSAVQSGQRYQRADIENIVVAANVPLAPAADVSRAEPIKSLVAHLAYGYLASRRGFAGDALRRMAPLYEDAEERLNELASGERVLDLDAAKAATVPSAATIGTNNVKFTQYNLMFGVWPGNPINYLYPGC